MSAGRLFPVVVVLLWMVSMGWLVGTKVLPMVLVPAVPSHYALPAASDARRTDRWDLLWKDRTIGTAVVTSTRTAIGGQIDSDVSFDRLPIDEMLNEFFGPANRLLRMAIGDARTEPLSFGVKSTLFIDHEGGLESFFSRVRLDHVGDLLQLRGRLEDAALDVSVTAIGDFWPEDFPRQLAHKRFDIPANVFITDAFSPQPRLSNLHVGQSWRFHSYRAIYPSRPLQLVEARVESLQDIVWQGNVENVFVVSLRDVTNELSSTDDFLGRMWVRSDGVVLRQLVRAGNLEIVFIRHASANTGASLHDSAH